MIFYKEEDLKKYEKTSKKWVILTIFAGILAVGLFVILLIFSTYKQKLLYQLLSSLVLSIYGIFLVFVCDVYFLKTHYLKKHYVFSLMSGSDEHFCEVVEIKKIITVSPKIKAQQILVNIEGKEIIYYLLEGFQFNFKVGDKLIIETKNRFIFSIKETKNE